MGLTRENRFGCGEAVVVPVLRWGMVFLFSCLLPWRMGFCKGFSLFVDGCSSVFPLSDGVVVEDG